MIQQHQPPPVAQRFPALWFRSGERAGQPPIVIRVDVARQADYDRFKGGQATAHLAVAFNRTQTHGPTPVDGSEPSSDGPASGWARSVPGRTAQKETMAVKPAPAAAEPDPPRPDHPNDKQEEPPAPAIDRPGPKTNER